MKKLIACLFVFILTASSFAGFSVGMRYIREGSAGSQYKTFGRWELRMRYVGLSGTVNCFVLVADGVPGANPSDGPWQEYDVEICGDRAENLEIGVFVNSWGNGHEGQRSSQYTYDEFNQEFHTYACEWTPDKVTWELDGHVYYEARKEGSQLHYYKYSIYEPWEQTEELVSDYDWVSIWAKDSLRCAFDVWECTIPDWCGNWSPDNNGSGIFFSYFNHYIYTPKEGPDGSDFTLEFSEDYNGTEFDETAWAPYGCELKGGFAIGSLGAPFTGDLPTDPGDIPNAAVNKGISGNNSSFLNYQSDRITYNNSVAGKVSLSIFDMNGRLIRALVNSDMDAGEYNLSIDKSSIPAGSYVLSLTTNAGHAAKRFITINR